MIWKGSSDEIWIFIKMVFPAMPSPSFSYGSQLTIPNIPSFRKELFSVLDFEKQRMHFHDVIAIRL